MGKHRNIKKGDIFYDLEVIENLGYKEYYNQKATFYLCKCLKCGNKIEVPQPYLGKAIKDCGCGRCAPKKIIKEGTKFEHLTVIELGKHVKGRGYYYLCECDCKKNTRLEVRRDMLLCGAVTSCGCVHDNLFEINKRKTYKKTFVESTNVSKIAYNKLQKNNTSGCKGVSWHKDKSKWYARIMFQGKSYSLGYYTDIEQAISARKTAEKELHADFWKWYADNFPKEYECIKKKNIETTSQ